MDPRIASFFVSVLFCRIGADAFEVWGGEGWADGSGGLGLLTSGDLNKKLVRSTRRTDSELPPTHPSQGSPLIKANWVAVKELRLSCHNGYI